MANIHAEVSAVLEAAPERVYALFADYRGEHAEILPKGWALHVESGGTGAGTVFRLEMRVLGRAHSGRMRVSEPEPGRTIRETDDVSGTVTTFTADPVDGGRRTRVTIVTDVPRRGGPGGWIEALIVPGMLRRLYREELGNVARRLRAPAAAEVHRG